MERINIAELLKDCPKGMELDCPIYENVTLVQVKEGYDYPIIIETPNGQMYLSKYGCFSKNELAKCVIFPKGKTTWEGFVPPYKFKNEDIYYIKDVFGQEWVSIIKKCENDKLYTYVDIGISNNTFYCEASEGTCYCKDIIEHRLATEEEKQKLFGAIKANGYYWNAENKTLEKLPKFKDEDILFVKATYSWIIIYKESENEGGLYKYVGIPVGIPDYPDYTFMVYDCNHLCCKDDISEIRLATEEEKKKLFDAINKNGYKWNSETKTLEKVIQPKFKVGDRIRNKNYKDYIYNIYDITDKGYRAKEINADSPILILFGPQEDNYELVPNKFDATTLVPFESKVLVRDTVKEIWKPDFFGCLYDSNDCPYMVVGGIRWKYCIPYEGNEHLLGKTDDCDEYYKIWE